MIRMWSANYNEKSKEVLSWDIPMTYTVYHIRNGTVSIEIDSFGVGYYVDTVRKNSKAIGEYIRNQLKKDYITEELELEDSFTEKCK